MAETLPSDEHVDYRDFRIESISLIDSSGIARDIRSLLAELQVRQDMYTGFMSGEALVNDGVDLFTSAAMHGNEYLYLHLREPGVKRIIKKAFRVYKVSNREPMQNNMQRYVIYFVSDELVKSNMIRISKAYKNSKISDIATDIMKTYLSLPAKRMNVEATGEAVSYIIPSQRPTEALQWLASRAFNADRFCYFFFENLDGFHFRSLQGLYNSPNAIKVPLTYEHKGVNKQLEMQKYAVDDYQSKKDFDVLLSGGNGGYAMQLLAIDPIKQSAVLNEYNTDKLPKMFKNAATSNPVDNSGRSVFDKSDAYQLVYLAPDRIGEQPKEHTEAWIRRVSAMTMLNNSMLEIVLPGNLNVQAGTMVNMRFAYTITPSESNMYDERKSGRYLVVAVNHKFDIINHKFDTIFVIARDSFPIPLPELDSRLEEKITKLNAEA